MDDFPEIWKAVDKNPSYEVSNKGRVRRCVDSRTSSSGKLLKFCLDSYGYQMATLYSAGKSKKHKVHKLVTRAFLGICAKGTHVNHKNGIKTDNWLLNLEYCTAKENVNHALNLGLYPSGYSHPRSKLTKSDVLDIEQRLADGDERRLLAFAYDVNIRTIELIASGRHWTQR